MRRALALTLLAVATAAGCSGDRNDDAATAPTTTQAQPTATLTEPPPPAQTETTEGFTVLDVYFLRGEHIGASTRRLAQTQAVARAALTELLGGPDAAERAAGLTTAIPSGTRVLDVDIGGGVATVDLSGAFERGGGSASMLARVAQVVHTLTQFSTVERVAFRIDGRPVDAIGGEGVTVDPPVTRADFEAVAPPILVESPGPGDSVTVPISVRGTANTFEATLFVRVVDASGNTLVDQLITATSGSGTRGTFSAALDVDGSGPATIVAYERSAENGEMTHIVRIPIRLSGG